MKFAMNRPTDSRLQNRPIPAIRPSPLLFVGVAIVGLLISSGCGRKGQPTVEGSSPPAVDAEVIVVSQSDAPVIREVTGTVHPEFSAMVSAKLLSRIVEVPVREGDAVRKGQILVKLDSRDLQAQVGVASAQVQATQANLRNAHTALEMEESASAARVNQAEAAVAQARAALRAAQSQLDLALAGPREQERLQAKLAVDQAKAQLDLAERDYDRMAALEREGAVSKKQLDQARAARDVAKAQYDTAVQAELIAREGTRNEQVRAAREAVRQAEAGVRQAEAAHKEAVAARLRVKVRSDEIRGAEAQLGQARASLALAQTTAGYATVTAPFDGLVAQRMVDPGATAAPGVPLLEVVGGQMRLEATVPESVLPAIQIGTSVPVVIDATGVGEVVGKVVEISPKGDPGSHVFVVKIGLPAGTTAKVGMFGRARFEIARRPRLLIPSDSTWEREGLHYVLAVNEQGFARLRMVTIGDRFGDRVEALSGVNSGDRIVKGGLAVANDGVPIRPKPVSPPTAALPARTVAALPTNRQEGR